MVSLRQRSPVNPSSGFTIVELVLVIVVIGILAAIVMVSYNGIIQKARNSAMISSVSQYKKIIALYAVNNGQYPSSLTWMACLGTGYDDSDGDGTPDCGDASYPAPEVAAFNDALRTVAGSLPAITIKNIPMPFEDNAYWRGAIVAVNNSMVVDGTVQPYYIEYALQGKDADCGLDGVLKEADGQNFPKMQRGPFRNSWYDDRATQCIIGLPNL